jgi:TolA-binding protein
MFKFKSIGISAILILLFSYTFSASAFANSSTSILIKSLQKEVSDLQQENEQLKSQNDDLNNQITTLQSTVSDLQSQLDKYENPTPAPADADTTVNTCDSLSKSIVEGGDNPLILQNGFGKQFNILEIDNPTEDTSLEGQKDPTNTYTYILYCTGKFILDSGNPEQGYFGTQKTQGGITLTFAGDNSN